MGLIRFLALRYGSEENARAFNAPRFGGLDDEWLTLIKQATPGFMVPVTEKRFLTC